MEKRIDNIKACEAHGKAGRTRLRLMAVLAGAAGALLLGGGVFAAWAPSAAVSSGSYGAAHLAVALVDANGTTFSTGVSNLLPGDYLNRYADLSNTGSVAQTFSGSISGTGTLASAMTVRVDVCSVAWSSNGSCSGTTTQIIPETSTAAPVPVSFPSLASNSVGHAKFRYKLIDAASQATYQGTSGGMQVSISGAPTVAGGQDRTAG